MISIIVPVYNSSSTIIQCLLSIVKQESFFFDKEIVIINDGSTDNSEKLILDFIKEHEEQDIKYISKSNGGVSSARNLGIHTAKYEWVAFLDSDDIWLPNKLTTQFNTIESSAFNIDFLGCARNGEVLSILGRKVNKLHKARVIELLVKMFPQTSTAVVKKSVILRVGCYDETMTHSEDGDLWIRICSIADFYYLPLSLVITGDGKPNFGASGLSANLPAMEKGVNQTLKRSFDNKMISLPIFVLLRLFYKTKYIRRILITKFRQW
ncbi:glycosyltransferase family 2 protein [Shewanella baltica]|uniref:glycosyltransferase family 2 protein n=1 Tax=Shewanella baltica TaxID=62322 RepID=UPI00217D9162|nr:glycosyltransferase family 2 protein [Shewanella baltica]MCS6229733.1 glycosyltransferase family 2 protein [Shewanella baltica]